MARPRRVSSTLQGDPRGDTGAPAVSTLDAPIASPQLSPHPSSTSIHKLSKRTKARSWLRRWKKLSLTHTWVNPLILTLIILGSYLVNPQKSNPFHKAIFLSYPLEHDSPLIPVWALQDRNHSVYYGKGKADLAFVAFYTIVLSFTRELIMQRVLRPLARSYGIRSRSKQSRFMEQAYTAIYFSVAGPLGLYVMSRTPVWYFETDAFYEHFPHKSHDGWFKAYYLIQASYWTQQAIVLLLGLEAPRKDYYELIGHHVVTISLIAMSYRFHFTYFGIAVYITHDISDFFLATAKTLNYVESPITVPYFVFFMGVWAYMRHYLNLTFLWSVLTTFRTIGPFEINWETQQYKGWLAQYIAITLLGALQLLNIFWFGFILRIAYRAIFGEPVKDTRSEDEGTELEEDTKKTEPTLASSNGAVKKDLIAKDGAGEASGVDSIHVANGITRITRSGAKAAES